MSTTRTPEAMIVADNDGDPFVARVEFVETVRSMHDTPMHNRWRWTVESTTDAADWRPVRRWTDVDLTSAIDVADPNPIAALCTLGASLADYADTRVLDPHDTGALFYGMPQDLARAIADTIVSEWPEDDEPCPVCRQVPPAGVTCCPDLTGDTGCHVACEPAPSPHTITESQAAALLAVIDLDRHLWYDIAPSLSCIEIDTVVTFLRAFGEDEDVCASIIEAHAEADDEGDAHRLPDLPDGSPTNPASHNASPLPKP